MGKEEKDIPTCIRESLAQWGLGRFRGAHRGGLGRVGGSGGGTAMGGGGELCPGRVTDTTWFESNIKGTWGHVDFPNGVERSRCWLGPVHKLRHAIFRHFDTSPHATYCVLSINGEGERKSLNEKKFLLKSRNITRTNKWHNAAIIYLPWLCHAKSRLDQPPLPIGDVI